MLYETFKIIDKHYVYDTVSNNIYVISKEIYNFLNNKLDYNNLHKNNKILINNLHKNSLLKFTKYSNIKFKFLDQFNKYFKYTNDSIKKLTLILNQNCNLNCKYCLYGNSYKNRKNLDNSVMSITTALKAVDFYFKRSKNIKQKNITFYGGEPLINYNILFKIINYARKQYGKDQLKINLTVNGTLLNKEIIQFFKKNKIFLNISLDGPKKIHNKYRLTKNKKNTFNLIIKKIALINQEHKNYFKKYVAISVTITPPYNFNIIENFFKTNKILNLLKLDLSYVEEKDADWLKKTYTEKNIYKMKADKEIKIIQKCTINFLKNKKINDLYKNIFFTRLKSIVNRDKEIIKDNLNIQGPCFPGLSMLAVNTNGDFNICTMLDDCFCIGNINSGFNKKAIKNSLDTIFKYINKSCRSCWLVRLCHPCIAKFNRGEIMPSRNEICNYRRAIYLEIIKSYIVIINKSNKNNKKYETINL